MMDYVKSHPIDFPFSEATEIPVDDPEVYKLLNSTSIIGLKKEDINSDVASFGIPEMGTKITADDVVAVDGVEITNTKTSFVYLAFNKPVGIVCTTDTGVEKDNIIDFINYPKRIFPIGRLDKASEGLIFMTDDGDIVNKILRARNNHEKEYIVQVDQSITKEFIEF